MQTLALLPALASFIVLHAPGGNDWPQFRGENGTGVTAKADIPLEWSASKNLAWKVAVPGQGWSQPVVVGGVVYLTTAVASGLERPMGFEKGVQDPRTMKAGAAPDVSIDWQVLALDLKTGATRWTQSAASGKPKFPIHPSNTYATETPCADAGGVYAYFGATGTVAAFDPAGKLRWKKELGVGPTMNGYGTASSPALFEGKLFVQCFDDEHAFLVGLDTKTGAETWRATREKPATSWSSPLVWHNGKRVEVVASGGRLITSHDPASGKELWRIAGVDGPTMCSFAADAERLYFGGQKSPMANPPLYALSAGATGDLSPAAGSTELRSQAWAQKSASPGMPSPVAADGLLYVAVESILTCRDAGTGEELYKERVGEGTIAASPVIVGDRLLFLDELGNATVVRVGPEFEVIGKGQLDDTFWATPTPAGDALLLRGLDNLYCVRG